MIKEYTSSDKNSYVYKHLSASSQYKFHFTVFTKIFLHNVNNYHSTSCTEDSISFAETCLLLKALSYIPKISNLSDLQLLRDWQSRSFI